MSIDENVKTPCYVIDIAKVCEKYANLKSEIDKRGRNDIIAYSVKANYNAGIIDSLNEMGAFFEVCSEYEYNFLKLQGIVPERIVVNGCTSTDHIFEWGKNSLVILDSLEQVKAWKKGNIKTKIGIRVNLDFYTKDNRFKNKQSRFGIEMQDLEVKQILSNDAVRKQIVCIQCHLSGNNREPSIYGDVIKEISKIIDEYKFCNINKVDVGGGFKVGSGKWNFSDYVDEIDKQCEHVGLRAQIIYEPGNSIVSDAACYCTKVIAEKKINGRIIKIVDGSSLHLPKTNLRKLTYEVIGTSGKLCQKQMVVGSTCKESDIITEFEQEPELCIGNILVFINVGAYSINEVNTLILGMPRIIIKAVDNEIVLGERKFIKICDYSDCIGSVKSNDFTIINKNNWATTKQGLYAFCNDQDEIIYIGAAFDRVISKRVPQHFRDGDSGGLRFKLIKNNISLEELEKSTLYGCPLVMEKQDILFEEAYLIGSYRPKYNFL